MRPPRTIDAWRCARGHVALHEDPACAVCTGAVRAVRIRADARLVALTTVRVNPRGIPFRLGIAVTKAGRARTVCVVEGPVRASGHDHVLLTREDGRVVARGRGLTARSPVPRPSARDSRRN